MSNEITLLAAVASLIERKGLSDELSVDTTKVPGHLIWERRVAGKQRGLRIIPIEEPLDLEFAYSVAWWNKDERGSIAEGRWIADLQHTIEAFSQFLIEGEELSPWVRAITLYMERVSAQERKP